MGKVTDKVKKLQKVLSQDEIAKHAYDHFVKITPIDTGAARKNTDLISNHTIHANYAYATRLDRGWSKQFKGQGMSQPTFEEIRKYIKENTKG